MTRDRRGILLIGGIGSGKSTAARYLEREYGAIVWSRTELMKDICHAALGMTGMLDGHLGRLWPETNSFQERVKQQFTEYISNYEEEEGKPYALYQDLTQIILDLDPLAFDRELLKRIDDAHKSLANRGELGKGKDLPFEVLNNISSLEGIEFFQEAGYKALRLDAPSAIRRERILRSRGVMPSDERLFHISQTGTMNAQTEWVVLHESNNPQDLYKSLDDVMTSLGIQKLTLSSS